MPEPADFRDPDVQRLIDALEAELQQIYGRPDQDKPPLDAFDGGAFFVTRADDGRVVSCGGVRELVPGVGEVKRMYTLPEARGQGQAKAILGAILAAAPGLGYRRLVLETGVQQPAAVAMYEQAGFHRIPPFGPYEAEPDSVCLGRDL